jgi:hypothetical protein
MAVGFLFPSSAGSTATSQMNIPNTASPAARDRPRDHPDFVDDSVFLLGLLYLDFGLAPEDAFRSALADYECIVERSGACLP